MNRIAFDRANLACGLIFIAFAAFFGIQSMGMEIGEPLRMGPGFFPLFLSGVLALLGLVIIIQAARVKGEPIGAIPWRGMLFILPAPIIFGLTIRGLGFVPALALTALIASFASHLMRPGRALLIMLGTTIFAIGVFSYGLGLPFRRFGPWIEFLGLR